MRYTVLFSVLAWMGAARAEAPSTLAIRDARVVTVSGGVLNPGTVVVRDGLIAAVGATIQVPADAWVIDGKGLTIYPGLVDALSTLGIPETQQASAAPASRPGGAQPQRTEQPPAPAPARVPEDRPSNTSWTRAADLVQPSDRRLEAARAAGFTTAISFPTRGIFAGQGAVINLAGSRSGDMVISTPAGLYVSAPNLPFGAGGGGFPGSLMGVLAYVRQTYLDAAHYRQVRDMYLRGPGGLKRPAYDRALEGVLEAPRVLLPAVTTPEIDRMLRFSSELKLNTVLYGLHQGYQAADILRKSSAAVLVNLRWPERSRESDPDQVESLSTLELREFAPATPAKLAAAGVPFAFYCGGMERPRDALRAVKRALDNGLTQEAAVRALTLSAAEIYGVADRLGSIDPGKIANLVVTRGDLFQDRTRIEFVLIDGVQYAPAADSAEEVSR
jgi:hypothetical protein